MASLISLLSLFLLFSSTVSAFALSPSKVCHVSLADLLHLIYLPAAAAAVPFEQNSFTSIGTDLPLTFLHRHVSSVAPLASNLYAPIMNAVASLFSSSAACDLDASAIDAVASLSSPSAACGLDSSMIDAVGSFFPRSTAGDLEAPAIAAADLLFSASAACDLDAVDSPFPASSAFELEVAPTLDAVIRQLKLTGTERIGGSGPLDVLLVDDSFGANEVCAAEHSSNTTVQVDPLEGGDGEDAGEKDDDDQPDQNGEEEDNEAVDEDDQPDQGGEENEGDDGSDDSEDDHADEEDDDDGRSEKEEGLQGLDDHYGEEEEEFQDERSVQKRKGGQKVIHKKAAKMRRNNVHPSTIRRNVRELTLRLERSLGLHSYGRG